MAAGVSTADEIGGQAAEIVSPTWARLEEQIAYYDREAKKDQLWFRGLKVCQIVVAAAIPVMAGASAPAWLVGSAGALIVVLEGLQQLMQFQQNWSSYRTTCEQLRHERFLFQADAGPYATSPRPEALLAEQIESLVSQEHAAWTSQQQEAQRRAEGSR
ncbi:MAG TPA: DUF4231 domain-containing protein [Solirubrobacterales bacterium]|nr:DUF4231 domain-containing protein [Solirubrobacterales bacterium]